MIAALYQIDAIQGVIDKADPKNTAEWVLIVQGTLLAALIVVMVLIGWKFFNVLTKTVSDTAIQQNEKDAAALDRYDKLQQSHAAADQQTNERWAGVVEKRDEHQEKATEALGGVTQGLEDLCEHVTVATGGLGETMRQNHEQSQEAIGRLVKKIDANAARKKRRKA